MLDDKILNKSNYSLKSGSTILTLNASFLKTVKDGKHKVTFVYEDGEVDTYLTVKTNNNNNNNTKPKEETNPKTGDNIYSYIAMFIFSIIGLTILNRKIIKH